MVKHTQTIRRLLPMNCSSVFDHFVRLTLKWLTKQGSNLYKNILHYVKALINLLLKCKLLLSNDHTILTYQPLKNTIFTFYEHDSATFKLLNR